MCVSARGFSLQPFFDVELDSFTSCPLRARCAIGEACEAFAAHVETGEAASARVRLAWQRRRERAAARGLTMSAREVRELRIRLQLTQQELASVLGSWRRSSIERWELGHGQAPIEAVKLMRRLVRSATSEVTIRKRNRRRQPVEANGATRSPGADQQVPVTLRSYTPACRATKLRVQCRTGLDCDITR